MRNKLISSLVGTTFILSASGPAFAAAPKKKDPLPPPPPPAPVYSWTGWYAGLNAGWVDANGDVSTNAAILAVSTFPPTAANLAAAATNQLNNRSSGFIGGGQFGYNYQFSACAPGSCRPAFVAGFEADIQGLSLSGSASTSKSVPTPNGGSASFWDTNTTVSHRLDYLGTLRGRIGVLVTPAFLLYGTGGLAYGGVHSNTSMAITNVFIPPGGVTPAPPGFTSGSFSGTRTGWTVGGGLEWMFLTNWSAKVEYLHYDLGSATYSTGSYSFDETPTSLPGNGITAIATSATEHFRGDIVRAGVNWHF